MKYSFQKYSICFITFFVLAFLVSCGGKSDSDTSMESANQKPTLTFWHFWSEPSQRKAIEEIIAEFEKNENCTVQLTELSWNDGKTKLFAAFNSGTAPDVLELGSDWVAQFSHGGVLKNLSEQGFSPNNYIAFTKEAAMHNDAMYAVPWVVNTRVLFYNVDLLQQASVTVESIVDAQTLADACEKVHALGDDIYGFGTTGADPHRLYKKVLPFLWSNDGKILDETGIPILNSPENIEALEMYLSLARAGLVETQRQLDNTFIRGKLGFWISGSWLPLKIAQENPDLNYSAMLLPPTRNDGKSTSMSFAGGEYLAMSNATENMELATKFIQYLTDGKQALEFCKKVPLFPADKNYYNDAYFQTSPESAAFSKQLEFSRMTPVHEQWLDIEAIFEKAVEQALYGKKSAKEALDYAQERVMNLVG